jgi:hypothetical protein
MECWLSIHDEDIAVGQVAMHNFAADLDLICDTVSLLSSHV